MVPTIIEAIRATAIPAVMPAIFVVSFSPKVMPFLLTVESLLIEEVVFITVGVFLTER